MNLTDKTRKELIRHKEVIVVTEPLTAEDARDMFPYRPRNKYSESRFGGNSLTDDEALLLGGDAMRCKMCSAPTRITYLKEGICPDCDGRSECNGINPRVFFN